MSLTCLNHRNENKEHFTWWLMPLKYNHTVSIERMSHFNRCFKINEFKLFCSFFKDPCTPSLCLNGGTCNRAGSSYTCTCPDHYTGSMCADQVGELSRSIISLYPIRKEYNSTLRINPMFTRKCIIMMS